MTMDEATPYSEASIQAGKVRDAAIEAAFWSSVFVAEILPMFRMFRFRGVA